MHAKDILATKGADVVSISVDSSLNDAIQALAERNIGAVMVLDGLGAIRGILSERDIIRVLNGAPVGFRDAPVTDVMTAEVYTCHEDASLNDLLTLMTDKRIRHVPVVRNGRLMGMISIGDVVKRRIDEASQEAEALKSYISAG